MTELNSTRKCGAFMRGRKPNWFLEHYTILRSLFKLELCFWVGGRKTLCLFKLCLFSYTEPFFRIYYAIFYYITTTILDFCLFKTLKKNIHAEDKRNGQRCLPPHWNLYQSYINRKKKHIKRKRIEGKRLHKHIILVPPTSFTAIWFTNRFTSTIRCAYSHRAWARASLHPHKYVLMDT